MRGRMSMFSMKVVLIRLTKLESVTGQIKRTYMLLRTPLYENSIACIYPGHSTSVMGVMKIGNTVPRVGLEPTSLAFWAIVLPLHLPDVTAIPTSTCLCGSLPKMSVETTTIFIILEASIGLSAPIHPPAQSSIGEIK